MAPRIWYGVYEGFVFPFQVSVSGMGDVKDAGVAEGCVYHSQVSMSAGL